METPMPGMPVQHSSKAGMVALALILLIVGLVAGYFIGKGGTNPVAYESATPTTSSEMIGWKTYRDPVYKYEFSYPADWKSSTYDASKFGYSGVAVDPEFVYGLDETGLDGAPGSFFVTYLKQPDEKPSDFDYLPAVSIGPNNIAARYEKQVFGPYDEGETVLTYDTTFLNYYAQLAGGQTINGFWGIQITIRYPNDTSVQDKATYDQILSTFRFTK